jgi:hypothetical protein
MEDVQVPSYYILKHKPSEAELERVQRALCVTPCCLALLSVHDQEDYQAATSLACSVAWMDANKAHIFAQQLFQETGHPTLIIGDAELLDAVFSDGRKEKVACL